MKEPILLEIDDLTARRMLVIAPHPDDETLGCGGLIWLLSRQGRQFHVVFVTEGGASHPNSRAWPRRRLAEQREREAEQAMELLGIGSHERTFLRLPDADMPPLSSPAGKKALSILKSIVRDYRPELVLLPWRRDPHRDHRDAWALCQAALAAADSTPQTLEYTIWLDELSAPEDRPEPDEAELVAFDISDARVAKRRAVEAHTTQTTALIDDDPHAFRLSQQTIDRLTAPTELYWRPIA